jgi:prolyl 4-hydroxylase
MSTFLSDFIRVFDNMMPDSVCDEVIRQFEVNPAVTEGAVGSEHGPHVPSVRSCLDLNMTQSCPELNPTLVSVLQKTAASYRDSITGYVFPDQIALEQFRAKRYRSGGERVDQFAYHVDVTSHASARRFLSFLWYCNDVTEGGETVFPHQNIRITPKKGRVMVFPPLWIYPHSGERPISNDKYVVSGYLHYR